MEPDDIKTIRNRLGMTQQEMAEKLNVSIVCISRWERGVNKPIKSLQKRIAEMGREEKQK